jgi:hypothetical protein
VKDPLLRLAKRIREECVELDRIVDRVGEGWLRAQESHDDLYVDSVALNLHGFYNGLERLFELIATNIDGSLPEGANWHQVLLEQMAAEIPTKRPAVISDGMRDSLDEYRGFRHIVRNIYPFQFDAPKIQEIVARVPGVFSQVRAELLSFADFLEQ